MGCNCCRMLNSYMFKPQELQTNGHVNEAHSYEHDRSKSPTIKISELMNEGYNIIERDRFTSSQDLYNPPEKINAKTDDAHSMEPSLSPYAAFNENFIDDIKEQDGQSPQSTEKLSPTHPSSKRILNDQTANSDEPECMQHELSGSIQENVSLTESAILEVKSSNLTLVSSNDMEIVIQLTGHPNEENYIQDSSKDPPDRDYPEDSSQSNEHVLIERSRFPSLIDLMIERSVARDSKKCKVVTNLAILDDDMDPDVAEALAALAAAIAGEEYED
ncbi:PDCD10 and GCKIII kinases-associated protein 1 [Anomaloglossus baeobatrachus]|uniref:PDCD10 and GCKIII kinases-associated protein 1 n=1 Tax=Anomaloglossus baeobatrachus TaxID=238106 RepID=UPI003F501B16